MAAVDVLSFVNPWSTSHFQFLSEFNIGILSPDWLSFQYSVLAAAAMYITFPADANKAYCKPERNPDL